ncbi:MAG: PilZ domain-containing protein [Desulfoprunum sp.]
MIEDDLRNSQRYGGRLTATTMRFSKMINRRSFLRRKQPRAAVTWPVTVFRNNKTLRGKVSNISRGGALLCLAEQPEPRDSIRIVVEIPDCNDVVTAEGSVVRTFLLKRGGEQQFPFAVAVEFTEISEKNIRLIAGVLAPEWQQDYVEPKETAEATGSIQIEKYAVIGIVCIGVGLLLYYMSMTSRQEEIDGLRIEQMAEKLALIESQLKSLHSANVSMTDVAGKIDGIRYDLNNVKNTIPEMGKVEKLVERLESKEQGDSALHSESGDGSSSLKGTPAAVEDEVAPSPEPAYHVVEKGENLYRISLNYHLKIDYLRQVNGLDVNSQIYPGQVLLVK